MIQLWQPVVPSMNGPTPCQSREVNDFLYRGPEDFQLFLALKNAMQKFLNIDQWLALLDCFHGVACLASRNEWPNLMMPELMLSTGRVSRWDCDANAIKCVI